VSKDAEAWMPIYIGDYLGDTQRLTTEQHGAYLLLIFDYWRNGPAPDDDAVLQQITRLERAAWKRHRPALEKLFQIVDGHWHHRRIERELVSAKQNQERRSNKARAAAQARWEQSSGKAESNAPSMPQALLGECPPPSPSPSPDGDTSGVSTPEVKRAEARGTRLPTDFVMPDDWIEWAMSERAWTRQDAENEASNFHDHWIAKPGKDGRKIDWAATWRNWVRNSRRQAHGQRTRDGRYDSRMRDPILDDLALNGIAGLA